MFVRYWYQCHFDQKEKGGILNRRIHRTMLLCPTIGQWIRETDLNLPCLSNAHRSQEQWHEAQVDFLHAFDAACER